MNSDNNDSRHGRFSIQELNNVLLPNLNAFSLLHIDCRSLNKNYSEIEMFLNQIKSQFNILALTETWLIIVSCPQICLMNIHILV